MHMAKFRVIKNSPKINYGLLTEVESNIVHDAKAQGLENMLKESTGIKGVCLVCSWNPFSTPAPHKVPQTSPGLISVHCQV